MPRAKGRRPRHIPTRTCVSCRTSGPKRDFVRVVRRADGRVEVDDTGKLPGRGAYLCRRRTCWDASLAGKKDPLGHALKTNLSDSDREALMIFAGTLPAVRDEEGLEN